MANLPAVNVGDRVQVFGEGKGRVMAISNNLGFTTWEIQMEQTGKVLTEARYKLDVIMESKDDTFGSPARNTSSNINNIDVFEKPDLGSDVLSQNDFSKKSINQTGDTTRSLMPDEFETRPSCSNANETQSGDEMFMCDVDVNVDDFIMSEQNKNTLRKTESDMSLLTVFLKDKLKESREIHNIPVTELSKLLCLFFMNVKTKDGNEYEPSTIRGMACSFDRFLKFHNYGYQISTSEKFQKVREVIKMKQKQLKREGKGNLSHRADALTDEDVDKLYECNQLGSNNPESLLRSVWFNNTIHFGMRGVTEHHNMKWGDVQLNVDGDGTEYLEYRERQTKTRSGAEPRNCRQITPRAWATPENPSRCPVSLYKIYSDRRPPTYSDPDHPFYIATNTSFLKKSEKWFKSQAVGVNKLSKFMPTMAKNAGLSSGSAKSSKRLTNHSARKYLVQKLNDVGVPPTQIMQISGHKNVQSINAYSTLNPNQQREISSVLSRSAQTQINRPGLSCAPSTSTGPEISMSQTTTCSTKFTSRNSSAHPGLINGPIFGGTFTINVNNIYKQRKAVVIDSDSD